MVIIDRLIMKVLRTPSLVGRIKRYAKEGDRGYGDTLRRVIEEKGLRSFPRIYAFLQKVDCNCDDRAERLNEEFSYPEPEELQMSSTDSFH